MKSRKNRHLKIRHNKRQNRKTTKKTITLKKYLYHTQPYDNTIKPGTYHGYLKNKFEEELTSDLNVVGDFYLPKVETIVPQEFTWTNVVDHKYYPKIKGNFSNPIQNQHSPIYCGCCWIINSLDVYASNINIYNRNHDYAKPAVQFSTQEVLNWFVKHKSKTCVTGGSPYEIGMYLLTFNVNYESNNTFLANDKISNYDRTYFGTPHRCDKWGKNVKTSHIDQNMHNIHNSLGRECVVDRPYDNNKAKGFLYVYTYDEMVVKQLIYLNGAITTCVASDYLLPYTSGIVGYNTVKGIKDKKTDHLISIVGWGEERDSKGRSVKYWIAKNSWGQYWGEDGYFRIIMNNNYLGIETVLMQFCFYDKNFKFKDLFTLVKKPVPHSKYFKDAHTIRYNNIDMTNNAPII